MLSEDDPRLSDKFYDQQNYLKIAVEQTKKSVEVGG